MVFFGVIDRVARDLYCQVFLADFGLTGQTGRRGESPGAIQQVLLGVCRLLQRGVTLLDDHMASCAGTGQLAGVLNLDVMIQQHTAN